MKFFNERMVDIAKAHRRALWLWTAMVVWLLVLVWLAHRIGAL